MWEEKGVKCDNRGYMWEEKGVNVIIGATCGKRRGLM